jgi:hypothetical protein
MAVSTSMSVLQYRTVVPVTAIRRASRPGQRIMMTIPEGSVIEIVNRQADHLGLVEVLFDGERISAFQVDLEERSTIDR